MRCLVVLSLVLACAFASDTALQVTWGLPLTSEFFLTIPRAVADLQDPMSRRMWVDTTRPAGSHLPSLAMYCMPDDLTFCALYDTVGVIAGFQIALSKELFTELPYELTSVGFTTWAAPDGVEYWATQQYFVSEETEAAGITVAANVTLREGAVWVVGEDGNLMRIGATGNDMANSDVFTEQACVATMGLHYFYGMYPEATNVKLYPWFTLLDNDALVGSGIAVLGKFAGPAEGKRMWFEQPALAAVHQILPRGPEWVYQFSETLGITTMHVYYDDKHPYTLAC